MLATVKQNMSVVWGLAGLIGFVVVLMSAIKIYKNVRDKKSNTGNPKSQITRTKE
jgi:protoporphyrinogen IX oxidase